MFYRMIVSVFQLWHIKSLHHKVKIHRSLRSLNTLAMLGTSKKRRSQACIAPKDVQQSIKRSTS